MILENYECDGQTDIFDYLEQPKGYFKCDTCVFYRNMRWPIRKDDKPKMGCLRADRPEEISRVTKCDKYKPYSIHFKCCETCKFGNAFCEANCWLVDKEKKETPGRHHREGFPEYGKGYGDNHEWDLCDEYKPRNAKEELL